jgi:hypothetical protein
MMLAASLAAPVTTADLVPLLLVAAGVALAGIVLRLDRANAGRKMQ